MDRRRAGTAIVIAACAASVLAGCGDDGGAVSGRVRPAGSELQQALARIAADHATVEQVLFSRPAAATRLLPTDRRKRLYSPYYGLSYLGVSDGSIVDGLPAVGIELSKARYVYTAGRVPHSAAAIVGVDTAKLRNTLKPLATSVKTIGASTTYRLRPDDEYMGNDKFERALPRLSRNADFNVVRATDSAVRYADSAADLPLADTDGRNLQSSKPVADVAGCLGNPLAAILTARLPGYLPRIPPPPNPPARPTPSVGVQFLGIGVGEGKDRPVDQLCVSVDTAAHARTIAATVKRTLATGSDMAGRRWSAGLASSRVEVNGTTVSVSLVFADGPPLRLRMAYLNADLPGVYG